MCLLVAELPRERPRALWRGSRGKGMCHIIFRLIEAGVYDFWPTGGLLYGSGGLKKKGQW